MNYLELHREAITIDSHNDAVVAGVSAGIGLGGRPTRHANTGTVSQLRGMLPGRQENQRTQIDLQRMREGGIDAATLWSESIVEAIAKCKVLIMMVSSHSTDSHNVVKEVMIASESKKTILPIYLEPADIPTKLKYQLTGIQHLEWFDGGGDDVFEILKDESPQMIAFYLKYSPIDYEEKLKPYFSEEMIKKVNETTIETRTNSKDIFNVIQRTLLKKVEEKKVEKEENDKTESSSEELTLSF